MHIAPNLRSLRLVAALCVIIGAWWLAQPAALAAVGAPRLVIAGGVVVATILLAVGVAHWLLAGDRGAGVSFDAKGVALKLGHSAAFVAWDNIDSIGVYNGRTGFFSLGSPRQLGIALRDPAAYLQTYEARLPAGRGPLAAAVRGLGRLIRPARGGHEPTAEALEALRRHTGYHLLIPEAQVGARAGAVAELIRVCASLPR